MQDNNENELNFFDEDEVLDTIFMTDEDGNEIEFVIIDGIEIDGVNYLLAVDVEDYEDEESEAVILKEVGSEDDELVYDVVEDDALINKVFVLLRDNEGDYEIKF